MIVASILIKATVVLLLGSAVAMALPRAAAATRHFIWLLTLVGGVGVAAATLVVPSIAIRMPLPAEWIAVRLPIPAETSVDASEEHASAGTVSKTDSPAGTWVAGSDTPVRSAGTRNASWTSGRIALAVWLVGVVVVLGWTLLGHLGLARLRRRAQPLAGSSWEELCTAVARTSGVSATARLFTSRRVGSPVTWGVRRPVILLPEAAASWTEERRRVVLAHELAHAARGDYLVQLFSCLVCAVYWFHPLVWMATRQLRLESERACDDHVLARGTSGVEYAAHLLEVARHSRALRPLGMVAIGMARPSQLEGRLIAVLDEARTRMDLGRRLRAMGWVGAAFVILPVAALRPAAEAKTPPGKVPPADHSVTAKEGETLWIELETGGDLVIRGTDEDRVDVFVNLNGADAEDTRVTLERVRGGARLRSRMVAKRQVSSTSHDFVVQVPRRFDVDLHSSGGGVVLVDVEGDFSGETGGGDLRLERVAGKAHLSTGGGDIEVTDVDLDGSVTTGGGRVVLSKVRGNLDGFSGSGPVVWTDKEGGEVEEQGKHHGKSHGKHHDVDDDPIRYETEGVLHIQKAGGDILLDEAPKGAVLQTGGGDIRVGASRGEVEAVTGGGDIEIGPVAGSVDASTGAGDIRVIIVDEDGEEHAVRLMSGSGNVLLELPSNLSARFDLETSYTNNFDRRTRIHSDWELERSETDTWDDGHGTPRKYVRAKGTVGKGGPLIHIEIVNGDITVRRN